MKEFKHTPGPWSVKTGDWDESGDARYTLDGIKEVSLSDARLIAAAPDLLGALDEMLSLYGGPLDPDGRRKDDYELDSINRARAAIAKATGADQ